MIGSFLTRGLVLVFGYAYPAYECYKTVEKNKPEIEHLLFWCQYWILVAVLTVCERVGDAFISWVPMYSEAKLAFFIYLWYPKTRGTTYVYDSFFRPYVSKHENEIDRNLSELRTLAGDMIVLYWQRAASYGQTRVFEILHYIVAQPAPGPACAAQSKQAPAPHPAQNSQQHAKACQPSQAAIRRPAAKKKPPETKEPPSPASSTASIQHQKEVEEEVGPSQVSKQAAPAATSKIETANSASEEPSELREPEAEVMQIEPVPPAADGKANPAPKETVMDETIRVTRSRLRKARSGGSR